MIKPAYKVIVAFGDGQDNGYQYKVGDEYPRYGYTPTEERLSALLSTNNARGTAIIEVSGEVVKKEPEKKAEATSEPKKSRKQWN